jgi:dihydrofolate reductase
MDKCPGISRLICASSKKPPLDTRSLWGGTPGFQLAARFFVIGGAYTYREALPRISEAYITEIDQDFDGDTFFTMTDPDAWNIEEVGTFEDGGCTGRFTHWVRK